MANLHVGATVVSETSRLDDLDEQALHWLHQSIDESSPSQRRILGATISTSTRNRSSKGASQP